MSTTLGGLGGVIPGVRRGEEGREADGSGADGL